MVSRSNGAVGAHESGWKDVLYLPVNTSATFVAKFDDYADAIHPFMYHCHFAPHEDGGMMGQFVVTDPTNSSQIDNYSTKFSVFPNPATNRIYVNFEDSNASAYYIKIVNALGKTIMMLPKPDLQNGIDISNLSSGIYFIQLMDNKYKKESTQKFIVK